MSILSGVNLQSLSIFWQVNLVDNHLQKDWGRLKIHFRKNWHNLGIDPRKYHVNPHWWKIWKLWKQSRWNLSRRSILFLQLPILLSFENVSNDYVHNNAQIAQMVDQLLKFWRLRVRIRSPTRVCSPIWTSSRNNINKQWNQFRRTIKLQVSFFQIDNGLETAAFQDVDNNSRLALWTTLVLFYPTHQQGERNNALDSDTFDYDQHDYVKSADCSP